MTRGVPLPQPKRPTTAFEPPAPAERTPAAELARQRAAVVASAAVQAACEIMPLPMAVLNAQRQIVYANEAFARTCGSSLPDRLVGRRFGEALRCHNSSKSPGGCGTTDACRSCVALQSILAAARGEAVAEDCRITTEPPARELDVRIWTRPFAVGKERFIVLTMIDVSDQKRREALERIFFHDVLNTAAQVKAFGALIEKVPAPKASDYVRKLLRSSDHLVEQIEAQRDLAEAERGDLGVQVTAIGTRALLESIAESVRAESTASDCAIGISSGSDDVEIATDPLLLTRVLSNLVKNAVEASPDRGTVTAWCVAHDRRVEFRVHNDTVMPPDVQHQVFQRSFSTKGRGRGLGAYGAKLLTERYLHGSISFQSTEEAGTTFVVSVPRKLHVPHRR